MSLWAILVIPLLALALPRAVPGLRLVPGAATVTGAFAVLGLAVQAALQVAGAGRLDVIGGWLGMDSFGALLLVLVAFVGATAAVFSLGYTGARKDDNARTRSYYLHFNLFFVSLLLVPMPSNPSLRGWQSS